MKTLKVEDTLMRTNETEIATFAAGCFWDVDASFSKIAGVISTEVGYMGGDLVNPTYEQVCSDKTGHAEVVRVVFDPKIITFEELLDTFWKIHDPTTLNRQGPDIGKQYRSAIFHHSMEQAREAERSKTALHESGQFNQPILTEITPATSFYKAEEYHQKYLQKHGSNH